MPTSKGLLLLGMLQVQLHCSAVQGLLVLTKPGDDVCLGSVVARQIKRAGGHIVVLIMVWVPTTTYQLALIFSGGQSDYFLMYEVLLLMLSLQVHRCMCMRSWIIH